MGKRKHATPRLFDPTKRSNRAVTFANESQPSPLIGLTDPLSVPDLGPAGAINQQHYQENSALEEGANFHIQRKDKVKNKVDIIVKDMETNSHRSLTIWGTGLGVENTIAVVEELKRSWLKHNRQCHQETAIKTGDNNEPHLQVILTLKSFETN